MESCNHSSHNFAEKQSPEVQQEGNGGLTARHQRSSGSSVCSPCHGKLRPNQTSSCTTITKSGPSIIAVNGRQNVEFSPPRPTYSVHSRVIKPTPRGHSTIQTRDREYHHPIPANRASWHALQNVSDSEEDDVKSHGNRSVPSNITYAPVDKPHIHNDDSAPRFKSRHNGNNQFGSKTSMTSKDSDYSSSLSRQRTPSPPLKLPSARLATGRHRRGHVGTRGFEGDPRLSTSSSESSLPPLQNRNTNYNSSNSSINSCSNSNHSGNDVDTWTARFCHQCGSCYPVSNAKFCCECGARRLCVV